VPARPDPPGLPGLPDLGIRPLNARSLVLSILLGLPDPALPGRALVATGDVFGVAPGTMRTALSRMVAAGELAATDGEYRLAGRLLERKAAQDIGRRPPPEAWDGAWWVAVVTAARRDVAQRRAFRSHMSNLRMGELRPDTWMRPANLDGPVAVGGPGPAAAAWDAPGGEYGASRPSEQGRDIDASGGDHGLAVVRGPLTGVEPADLVGRLWPLSELAERAGVLLRLVDDAIPGIEAGEPTAMADTIELSAAVVRFLRAEPLLPPSLTPHPWPPDELRARYRRFDAAFGRVLLTTVAAHTP
jgi:phenylacetic acid degradation operon negative regulatory protein